MTPINRERIIRAGLRAIVEGEGTIDARMEAVSALLEKLSATDRRLIVKTLKPKLSRALRQKTATLRMAGAIDEQTKLRLRKLAEERGMVSLEEIEIPALLAGFSLQLGDNRTDYSLKGRVEQLA